MTKLLKKSAKPLTYTAIVFAGVFLIITLLFMTNYKYLRIENKEGSLSPSPEVETGFPPTMVETKNIFGEIEYKPVPNVFLSDTLLAFNEKLQDIDNFLLSFTIVIALGFAALCIFSNTSRRKYYISNLLVGIVVPIVNIVMSIVGISKLGSALSDYRQHEDNLRIVEAMQKYTGEYWDPATQIVRPNVKYSLSSFTMNITDVLMILFIIYSVLYAVYSVVRFVQSNSKGGNK